ncbi:hypothetical protein ACFV27_46850 [Streptomyces antimycoticus]|uniref:hypothetical protein n=1 Tax=Streptomyces antimycoticus TaxID=68175 RepID=UPI0036813021
MAYSLFLLGLERLSPCFRDSVWGNIVVAVQLKSGVLLYTVLLARTADAAAPTNPSALTVVAFLLVYLSWEAARKTVREPFARPGEKLYSTAAGATASLTVASALLLVGCACRVAVAASWQSWAVWWRCTSCFHPRPWPGAGPAGSSRPESGTRPQRPRCRRPSSSSPYRLRHWAATGGPAA